MDGYWADPTSVYPFAVNGLLAVSQIFMVFLGSKIPQRVRV